MKRIVFMASLIASLAQPVLAQESAVRNGKWWTQLPTQEVKWGFLVGFFDGMGLGHRFSWWGLEADEKNSDCVPHVIDAYRDAVRQYLARVDSPQLASALDTFYANPKNRPIKIADAVWIVANKIAGKSDAEVETLSQDYRGN